MPSICFITGRRLLYIWQKADQAVACYPVRELDSGRFFSLESSCHPERFDKLSVNSARNQDLEGACAEFAKRQKLLL
jgi:hypothetical protein